MRHEKFEYVKKVVEHGMPVLLEGEAGCGKTTIAIQIAEDLGRPFSSMSMTKQTSVNAIIGFKAINGNYIPSAFREAYENGHVFLLDELDAADANVLLTFNTLENGYMAFPDQIVNAHKDFRLIATANPQGQHSIYTGRSKLDFSTLDRFYQIVLPRDPKLEESLTSVDVVSQANLARKIMEEKGITSFTVSMRDVIRIHDLTNLGLDESPIEEIVLKREPTLKKIYLQRQEELAIELAKAKKEAEALAAEEAKTQHEVSSMSDLWEKVKKGK